MGHRHAHRSTDHHRRTAQGGQENLHKAGATEPNNLEEQALLLVGRDIYEKLIKGYTEKQWGRKCTELPAFIIRRFPLRFVYDNNYFNDLYHKEASMADRPRNMETMKRTIKEKSRYCENGISKYLTM